MLTAKETNDMAAVNHRLLLVICMCTNIELAPIVCNTNIKSIVRQNVGARIWHRTRKKRSVLLIVFIVTISVLQSKYNQTNRHLGNNLHLHPRSILSTRCEGRR